MSNTPSLSQVITKQINQGVRYAGIDITIQSVQQANSFPDDSNSGSNGVIRIYVKENNPAAQFLTFLYTDVVRLILPDQSSVAPSKVLKPSGPQVQTTQTNWWDFQVSTSESIDQLILQLGESTEAHMQIPLTGHADLSQYQPKTVTPNASVQPPQPGEYGVGGAYRAHLSCQSPGIRQSAHSGGAASRRSALRAQASGATHARA
jgi:hypothetical protein